MPIVVAPDSIHGYAVSSKVDHWASISLISIPTKPDDARVRAMIEEMASAYQEPEQVVAWYYKNDQQMNEVRSVVLEEQVVDTVLQKAKVTDKTVSYEEAIKPAEAPHAA